MIGRFKRVRAVLGIAVVDGWDYGQGVRAARQQIEVQAASYGRSAVLVEDPTHVVPPSLAEQIRRTDKVERGALMSSALSTSAILLGGFNLIDAGPSVTAGVVTALAAVGASVSTFIGLRAAGRYDDLQEQRRNVRISVPVRVYFAWEAISKARTTLRELDAPPQAISVVDEHVAYAKELVVEAARWHADGERGQKWLKRVESHLMDAAGHAGALVALATRRAEVLEEGVQTSMLDLAPPKQRLVEAGRMIAEETVFLQKTLREMRVPKREHR